MNEIVTLEGQGVNAIDPHALTRVRLDSIGFDLQYYNLFLALTVLENVLYSLHSPGGKRQYF
ncbi:MAG: hypothetical protein ACYCYP_13235 [Leptospirales bacterium]